MGEVYALLGEKDKAFQVIFPAINGDFVFEGHELKFFANIAIWKKA